jgi:DNA polymerase-3 subunit beta
MKFILNSKSLLEKLQYLSGVIPSTIVLPILDSFLFKTENEKLFITGSDLDNTITTSVDLENGSNGNINIAIPGKILIEILKTLASQPLEFNVLENSTIEIVSSSGSYSIAYSIGKEFPELKPIENSTSTNISSKILSTAISKTLFATSNDDLRPVMTGVLFQMSPEGINFVATDAHKLVKYSRTDISSTESVDFIVPKKPLSLLKSIIGSNDENVVVEYNNANAKFIFGDYELTIRLIDGTYPAYEKVIPTENPNKLIIDRDQFLKSVKRVSLLSNKQTHQIKLSLSPTELNINAEDKDYSNKADERLTCSYEGEDIRIGFNARFLSEMLSNMTSEEIQLEMSVPNKAGIITSIDGLSEGENILMLVMPVQLK